MNASWPCLRLRGGGNDGGSIPKRIELVKTALAKGHANSSDAAMAGHVMLRICPLSGLAFGGTGLEAGGGSNEPVVGDRLGRLYRKEAMVEFLLDREGFGESGQVVAGHVKKLGQVETLKVGYNSQYQKGLEGSAERIAEDDLDWTDPGAAPFICPLTQKEISLKTPFVWIDVKTCHHLMSESGLKELISKDKGSHRCPICDSLFTDQDIIAVFPKPEIAQKQKAIYDAKVASTKKRKQEGSPIELYPRKKVQSDHKGPSLVEGSPGALVVAKVAAEQAKKRVKREAIATR